MGQNDREDVSIADALEQSRKIHELEQSLLQVQMERDNNSAAAEILNQMIADGDAEQDEAGSVRVSKRRPDNANVIGNLSSL